MFQFPMYTVPEDNPGSVPLCVNVSVEITEPITYTIETGHKFPTAEAEGILRTIIKLYFILRISILQIQTLLVGLPSPLNLLDQPPA